MSDSELRATIAEAIRLCHDFFRTALLHRRRYIWDMTPEGARGWRQLTEVVSHFQTVMAVLYAVVEG
jgi:hypothetical protein